MPPQLKQLLDGIQKIVDNVIHLNLTMELKSSLLLSILQVVLTILTYQNKPLKSFLEKDL